MKRAVASFFLYFAGIILLAHTFVPHHHHDHTTIFLLGNLFNQECVEYEQFSHDHFCDPHDCEVPKDDCHGKNKTCSEVNILLKGGEETKDELITSAEDIIPLLLLFSVENKSDAETDLLNSYFRYNNSAPLYHINYLPDSQGLRAPPAC